MAVSGIFSLPAKRANQRALSVRNRAEEMRVDQETTQQIGTARSDRDQALKVMSVSRGGSGYAAEKDALARSLGLAIPPVTANEEHAKLAAKHFELATRQSEISRDIAKARADISRGVVANRDNDLEDAAQALIAGRRAEAFKGAEELWTRVIRLEEEGKVYARALHQVKGRMDEIVSECSIDANEIAMPHHRGTAAKIADACTMLRQALKEEALIRQIVADAGYDVRLKVFAGAIDHQQLEQQAREYVG